MNVSSLKAKVSMGCSILILLPFLIAGCGMLLNGLYTILFNRSNMNDIISGSSSGAVFVLSSVTNIGTMKWVFIMGAFTTVSIGVFFTAFQRRNKMKRKSNLRNENPDKPWLWNEEWIDGKIPSRPPKAELILWILGIVFSTFGLPILFSVKSNVIENPLALIALIFPLIGLLMLAAAIYTTLKWYKYGDVNCEMVTHPGVVGG